MKKQPQRGTKITNDFPRRITDISERDFWSAMRPVAGKANRAELLSAIRLGRTGKKTQAYLRLGEYYRAALAEDWRILTAETGKQPKPSFAALKNLFRGKVTVWHTHTYQFGRRIDWVPKDLPRDSLHGMYYLAWLRPMVSAFIRQPDRKRVRNYLIDIIRQYYDETRRHPRWDDLIKHCMFGGLGIAVRLPVLLGIYLGLINTQPGTAEVLDRLLKTFLGFGRALDWALRRFLPGNNGFVFASEALFRLARTFPEFRESPAWSRKAGGFLLRHAREGFFADGGNRERVWGYGTMHVSGLNRFYALAKRLGGLSPKQDRAIRQTLRRACQWYFKSVTPPPMNAFPTYGDAGWSTHDRLPTIQAMAGCLPDFQKDPLLGVDRSKSYLLKPSGFAIMRNGNEPKSSYINVSFGRFAGWHSHWDLLSMNFWSQGAPLLEELCRFGPYCNPLDQLFRAPESHNLALIDGMVYDSRLVGGQDVQWFSNEVIDYFSAYHRAYRFFVYGRPRRPVRNSAEHVSPNIEAKVRRTIVLVKNPGYVVVLDSVENVNSSNFNLAISQYWHAPQPFRAVAPGKVRTEGKKACLLVYGQPESLHRLDPGVDFAGKEIAQLGQGYNRYSLRARRWLPLNHVGSSGFTTVIYPFTGEMPQVSVRSLPTANGSPWKTEAIEVSSPHGRDRIILNPEQLSCRRQIRLGGKGFAVQGSPVTARALVMLGNRRGECVVKANQMVP